MLVQVCSGEKGVHKSLLEFVAERSRACQLQYVHVRVCSGENDSYCTTLRAFFTEVDLVKSS